MNDFFECMRLNEQACFLRAILVNSRDGFWLIDSRGCIADLNEAYTELTGYSRTEIIGRSIDEINVFDQPGDVPARMKRIGEKGSEFFQTRHRCKDGHLIDLELTVTHLDTGDGHFICFFRDLSGRKEFEPERDRLSMAVDQVGDIIVVTDVQGTIQFVNPAFERITGYSRTEAIGQNPRLLKSGVQDEPFYKNLWETIGSGKTWQGRMVNKRPDGSFYTEESTISPVFDESGKTINYVAVKRDITAMLELEKRLSQAEKMEAIGVLAGGIAHDFNNILFPIIGFAELLLEDLRDDQNRRQKVTEIYTGARRAAELVQQILAFGRQGGVERRPISVQKVVREVISLARSAIPNNFSIEGDLGGDHSVIQADPTQLHQMVMNLITNAYQSMQDKSSGVIKICVELKEIEGDDRPERTLEPGTYVAIRVSDSGGGIDPALLDRIFEPYFTTKATGKGTGLGLAIVHGLVREYNGDITVESELGVGSTFTLYLPRRDLLTESLPQVAAESAAGRERILIVDDESAIVRMETIVLERLGYNVVGHSLSVEALDAFRADPQSFDLVITDMAMPVMSGLQLAKEMLRLRPDLPILICTGFSEQIDRQRIEALGIRGLLMKPLLSRELAQEVRTLLDESLRDNIYGRILVIDDESAVRRLIREKLSGRNCEILEAVNGVEGLAVCRRERLDLVITDLIMPDKEGIETIMELRREYPDLPVVAISGGGRSTHPEAYLSLAERLGARQVFAKPIDWPRFYRALADLLRPKENR